MSINLANEILERDRPVVNGFQVIIPIDEPTSKTHPVDTHKIIITTGPQNTTKLK